MNAYPGWEKHLNWLLNHSFQAGVLVVLVLAMQWLLRRRLTARWRFALWWIVIVRLLLPFSPQSAMSVFNYLQPTMRIEGPRYSPPVAPMLKIENDGSAAPVAAHDILPTPKEFPIVRNAPENASPVVDVAPAKPASPLPAPRHTQSLGEWLIPGAAGLWLGGVLVLCGIVAGQLIRFRRKLASASAPAEERLQRLLDDCRREFGVTRNVELLETGAVQSPALFGLLRLRLLVPKAFGGQFTDRELRYIFLHELAHVKRGDLWLNWLVTALQIVHWFNPLLWLGFARLRADRELACDELTLLRAGDSAGTAYGETVVKLLASLSRPAAIPGLIGILEDKQQMRRRIAMIASFRRPGRWSALALVLIAGVAAAALTDAQSGKPSKSESHVVSDEHPNNNSNSTLIGSNLVHVSALPTNTSFARLEGSVDLTGTVTAKGGGPLPTTATVFIETAAPKTGTSTFCPSCYPDCIKRSTTDARGNFKIEALDSHLVFQVLAVAKGYQPKSVDKVNLEKRPVKIELTPINNADAAPDRSLRGRVVNSEKKPIAGAVVDVVGIETKIGGGRWGSLPDIDPLAVTDENGEFLITAKNPIELVDVKVSARAFADKRFQKLPSGQVNELVLSEGAALTGRVLADGKLLAGVLVGMVSVDRTSQNFLGPFEIGTDQEGRFAFVNLPPNVDFHIYTLMRSMTNFGAVPLRQIHTGNDGATTDAGDMVAAPAHRLAGRLVLADGQPLPSNVRLLISRDEAWDSQQITLDADGHFDAAGVPNELVNLSARVKGYHISAQNVSLDQLNPFRLFGRVDRDITNLVFLLEKGPDIKPDYGHTDPDYNELRQRPLHGAEGGVEHSHEWIVSGRVLDAATKQPVQHFRVTPGHTDQFDHTVWNDLRAENGSNGVYKVYISKRTAQPMIKAEADDYLPAGMAIPIGDAINVDFLLQRGSGPRGTVVTQNGEPVAGAAVLLLKGEMNEAGINQNGQLQGYSNRAITQTDAGGNFSFKPEFNMKAVAVSSSNGFVSVNLDSLATNSTITLLPFGKINGTLKRTSGPGTNEILDVQFAGEHPPGLNMWLSAETGANGQFTVDHVPAGHLEISYRVPAGNNGWQDRPLQEVDLKPGQTLAVTIAASDRPKETPEPPYTPPPLTPIPGERIKGIVLRPDGTPAAEAEVVQQLTNASIYLALGHGTFSGSQLREKGVLVNAGADGSFDMPLFQRAAAVVAVSEDGFAQVSLNEFKQSPVIRLQKFGRVEGTLRVGHHLGTNETVNLTGGMQPWIKKTIRQSGSTNVIEITNSAPASLPPLMYESGVFHARTDAQGRFVFTFVPPGDRILSRRVPAGEGSWTQNQLAVVPVKPGETSVTNIGGTGRTVTGKLRFNDDPQHDFKQAFGAIGTPTSKTFEKARQLKTDAERKAFYDSPEIRNQQANWRNFSFSIASDGSFSAEDVLPGTYEISLHQDVLADMKNHVWTLISSEKEFTVPEAKNADDDSTVDLGMIELKKRIMPMPDEKK